MTWVPLAVIVLTVGEVVSGDPLEIFVTGEAEIDAASFPAVS